MRTGRPRKYLRISGIYQIQSIKKPERIYIGSASNIYKRWNEHIHRLRIDLQENKKLQRHYNKYGEDDLVFSLLLGCDKEDLLRIEQYFIDSYDPWFNICKKAGSSLGRPPWNKGMKGQYHRTKGCYQKGHIPANKGKKCPHYKWMIGVSPSQETRDKISKSQTGKPKARGADTVKGGNPIKRRNKNITEICLN